MTRIFIGLFVTLVVSLSSLTGVGPVGPAPAAWAGNGGACEADGGTAYNGLKVYPSHGEVFYIDTGQGQEVNAAYVGYRVENTSGLSKSNLWAKLDSFDGGVVSLANPGDEKYRIGDVAASATEAAFFLLEANQPTTTNQTHVLTVFDADPDLGGVIQYSCTFTFSQVKETIKAAANKVTDVAVATVEELGGSITVTVDGQSGQIGSGTSSPDGEVMWFSPAARSTWPSASLQLESTSIRFSTNKNFNQDVSTHVDNLIFRNPSTTLTGTASRYYYEATYVFRIRGPVSGTAQVIPIAQISSGTQIKHTDISGITSDADSSFAVATPVNVDVEKTASTTVTDSDADSKYEFEYTLTFNNSSANAVSLDQIVDELDTGLSFFAANDATFDGSAIADPGTNSDSNSVFQGPFTIPAGGSKTLVYTLEENSVCSGSVTYSNFAYGLVGTQVVGSSGTAIEGADLTTNVTCGQTATVTATTQAIDPQAITQAATTVTDTFATINGAINPTGTSRTVSFEYGTTAELFSPTTVNLSNSSAGSTYEDVNTGLTALTAGTRYYFRVKVGDVYGEILSFTTLQTAGTPTVTTQAASSISPGSGSDGTATLNGDFDANLVSGGATPYFQYGLANDAGATNSCTSPGALTEEVIQEDTDDDGTLDADVLLTGGFPTSLSLDIDSLEQNKYYCARAVAKWNSDNNSIEGSFVSFQVSGTATITYNGNSNTSGTVPSSATPSTGATYTVASNDGTLARTGWTFAGWNTAADGSGQTYAAGSGQFTVSGSLTLYAHWTASVTYNANSGSGAPSDSNTYSASDTVTVLSDSGMTRTNYLFDEWNTSSNGSGTPYDPTDTLSLASTGDITLWAQWTEVFTITYDANTPDSSALDSGSVTNSQTINDGSSGTVAGNSGSMVEAGYSFSKWNTQSDGGGQDYVAGASITPSSSLTLFAVWVANYEVTYLGNSNSGGTPPGSTSIAPGGSVAAAANTGTLVKTGFVFGGWNTNSGGTGTTYEPGESFIPASSLNLWALWLTPYTVSYDGNGNTSGTAPSDAIWGSGQTATASSNSGSLSRTGYTFAGWQTSSTGGTSYVAGSGTFTITADVTLYAKWTVVSSGNSPGNSNSNSNNSSATPSTPLIPRVVPRGPVGPPTPAVTRTSDPVEEVPTNGGGNQQTPNEQANRPASPSGQTSRPSLSQPRILIEQLAQGTVDLGEGVARASETPAAGADLVRATNSLESARRSPRQLASEDIQGFTPGESAYLEIIGARTGARFVVSETEAIDSLTLVRAMRASIEAQRSDFFSIDSIDVATQPVVPDEWNDNERDSANRLFEASGLPAPTLLTELDPASFTEWVFVQTRAETYVPGSTVYLTLTSEPVVLADAVVDKNGEVVVGGTVPAEFLTAGEHRVRLVGIRALDGAIVGDDGDIEVTPDLLDEIERFDLGTQSTIAFFGSNPTGGVHTAVRVIPLIPVAPWWTLWIIAGAFVLVSVMRRWGPLNSRSKHAIGGAIVLLSATPAVILGWLSTVTIVVWWGLGLGLLAMLIYLFVRPRRDGNQ